MKPSTIAIGAGVGLLGLWALTRKKDKKPRELTLVGGLNIPKPIPDEPDEPDEPELGPRSGKATYRFEDPRPTSEQLVGPLDLELQEGDRIALRLRFKTIPEYGGTALPGGGAERCYGAIVLLEYRVYPTHGTGTQWSERWGLERLDLDVLPHGPGNCERFDIETWWPGSGRPDWNAPKLLYIKDRAKPGFYVRYPWQSFEVTPVHHLSKPYTLKISWDVH